MQHITGRGVNGSYLIIVLAIATAMLSPAWVFAEDSLPDATAESPPVELTPTPVLDAPVIPESAEPTAVPTEELTPTPEHDPVPEQTPLPDAPDIPEPDPTEPEPDAEAEFEDDSLIPEESVEPIPAEGTPEPAATVTPEPTVDPAPVITFSQPEPVACQPSGGDFASIAYAQSQTWHCTAAVHVTSNASLPDDLAVTWMVEVSFPDVHSLSVPAESAAALTGNVLDGDVTHYVIEQAWQGGEAQRIAFDIELSRTTCAVGDQSLTVQTTPGITIGDSAVQIVQSGDSASVISHSIDFSPNLTSPEVSMSAVDFGTLKWNGESWGSARASSVITVANHHPCATAQAHTIELRIMADDGDLKPTLLSVDVSGSEFAAIERGGTSIATVPAGFTGSATIEVEFELIPTAESPAGHYRFGFEVDILPVP